MSNPSVGSLATLWRFPVKSMLGEAVDSAEVTEGGLVGDRAYGLVERVSGKVVSAKNVKAYPALLHCRAAFVETPKTGQDAPPVRMTLPSGRVVDSDAADANAALSKFFGRDVELRRAAPADYTIDEYNLDLANDDLPGPPGPLHFFFTLASVLEMTNVSGSLVKSPQELAFYNSRSAKGELTSAPLAA